jgi:flagellar hook-basal body complex protein FliE
VESISNNLAGSDILLSRMQSDSAIKKAENRNESGSEGIGGVLNSFGNILKDQMGHINQLAAEAGEAKQIYATGGDIELHNVLIAGEKAELSLQLAMQVRNKMVAAYQEISHMTV